MSPTYRLFRSTFAFLASLGLLAWSARVPLWFIEPGTSLLSFSVMMIALLGGVRLALVSTATYVGLVVLGQLPAEGLDPQALQLTEDQQLGYLVGLVPGGLLAAALSRRNGWMMLTVAALIGHVGIFATGVSVLAQFMGPTYAVTNGVWPYVFGAVVKSLFAATLVAVFRPPIDKP